MTTTTVRAAASIPAVRILLRTGAALALLSLAIPWTLSGQINAYERAEFAAGAVALLLLWWHPRTACTIGAIVWTSAVADYAIQLALGQRSLSHNPGLVAGIATLAIGTALFLLAAGEVLHAAKPVRRRRVR